MSDDWEIEFALRSRGYSDAQIAQVQAAIPKAKYVWDLINHNKTVAQELFDVIGMILTHESQKEQA